MLLLDFGDFNQIVSNGYKSGKFDVFSDQLPDL